MSEKEQIKLAKKGEQKAFSYLMDSYWDYVYSYQLKQRANEVEAEDISIETFAKAFDKIGLFNEELSFGTWLISISKNVHIDSLRKYKKFVYDEYKQVYRVLDESPSIEDQLIKEQNLSSLLASIQKLQQPYREVIKLRFLQEKSYKEIAAITGLTISNAKVVLLRAKKILLNNIGAIEK